MALRRDALKEPRTWERRCHLEPTRRPTILLVLVWGVAAAGIVSTRAAEEVSFRNDIAPVLQSKCVTCHGPDKQKGGFRLDSFEWLQKAGDSGDAPVVAGEPAKSLLIKLITTNDSDDRMPQKADPLPDDVIQHLKQWIGQGAKFDGSDPKQSLVDLAPPPSHPTPPESYPHPLPVLSLALLDQGKQIAIGGYHEILIRTLDDGQLVQRVTNLPERIHAILPANEVNRLIYAGGNPGRLGEMGVIEFASEGKASPHVLARSTDTFLAAATSKDGKLVAVGGADKIIRLVDLDSGKEIRELTQHADWVMGLAFSPDGKHLASASRDGTARIYDVGTGEAVCAFRDHDGPVFDVTFVGDGSEAASTGRDQTIRFWKTSDARQTKKAGGLDGEGFKLALRGNQLLCAVSDGSICELPVSEKKINRRLRATDGASPYSIAWRFANEGFVCGRSSGLVENWKLEKDQPLASYNAWP